MSKDQMVMSNEGLLRELHDIDSNKKYYAITLIGTAHGKIQCSVYSHWVGWENNKPSREIREASFVNAQYMADAWTKLDESYLVVNGMEGFLVYTRLGGNALVAKEIGEKNFSSALSACETAYDGAIGFKAISNLPLDVLKRAPSAKHRMKIIQRDQYKCKICGRNPNDYTDIELHVHHIRPWGKGGLTEDQNLITLCSTCHRGLQPHEDLSLFGLLDPNAFLPNVIERNKKYYEGLQLYREIAKTKFLQLDNSNSQNREERVQNEVS